MRTTSATLTKANHGDLRRRRYEFARLIKKFASLIDQTISDHRRPLARA